MNKIEAFSKEQLEDLEVLKKITEKVTFILQYNAGLFGDEIVEFNVLRIRLEEGLKKNGFQMDKDLYKKYLDFLIKISFVQMDLLGEEQIISLFKKHFLSILRISIENEISLENKIRAKVFAIPHLFKRDPFLSRLKEALKENIEILGENRIVLKSEEKPKEPSIQNWLADYDNMAGAGEHSEIEISNFLFKNKNTRGLSTDEKQILKKLLIIYERLKLDLFHPNSFSVYPLSLFGIKAVGLGLNRQYMPMEGEPETDIRKKEFSFSRPKVTLEEKLIKKSLPPQRLLKRNNTLNIKRKTIDLRKEKEKRFSHLIPISKDSLTKLSTPQNLAKLTVKDFKSFGVDIKSAGEFLLSRIKKLSAVSPSDNDACKYYLRQSELYKTYLSQGKEMLDTGEEMEKIVKRRENEGKPYLTEVEFEAVKNVFKSI